jgi:hypothetical protein
MYFESIYQVAVRFKSRGTKKPSVLLPRLVFGAASFSSATAEDYYSPYA